MAAHAAVTAKKARANSLTKMFRILGKRGRITIPYDIRQHVGFCQNDVLSFTESPDGSAVIVRREKICDDCKAEREHQKHVDTDSAELFDFLNGLTDEQQAVALYHLSAKWAERNGRKHTRE